MENRSNLAALILGGLLCAGLIGLGYLLSSGAVRFKTLDRTVTVKGLSEREVAATVAIWPIRFSEADNDLASLVSAVQSKSALIVAFLQDSGFSDDFTAINLPEAIEPFFGLTVRGVRGNHALWIGESILGAGK